MLLQDLGDAQPDVAVGAEGVEQKLPGDESFPLQRPYVDLLLAVRKRAVAWIHAALPGGDLCGGAGQHAVKTPGIHLMTSLNSVDVTFANVIGPGVKVFCRSGTDKLPGYCVFHSAHQDVFPALVLQRLVECVIQDSWTC